MTLAHLPDQWLDHFANLKNRLAVFAITRKSLEGESARFEQVLETAFTDMARDDSNQRFHQLEICREQILKLLRRDLQGVDWLVRGDIVQGRVGIQGREGAKHMFGADFA